MKHIQLYENFRDDYKAEIAKQFRKGEDPYDFSSRLKLASPQADPEEWPELEDEDNDEEIQKSLRLKMIMAKAKKASDSEPISMDAPNDTLPLNNPFIIGTSRQRNR